MYSMITEGKSAVQNPKAASGSGEVDVYKVYGCKEAPKRPRNT